MTRKYVFAAVLLAFFTLNAASAWATDPEPTTCTLDSECEAGSLCVLELCQEVPDCDVLSEHQIYFDFDETNLRSDQDQRLESLANCLVAWSETRTIELVAWADADPSETLAFKEAIAMRRGHVVRDALERLGLDLSNVEIRYGGVATQLCQDNSEACWRRQRMVQPVWAVPEARDDDGDSDSASDAEESVDL